MAVKIRMLCKCDLNRCLGDGDEYHHSTMYGFINYSLLYYKAPFPRKHGYLYVSLSKVLKQELFGLLSKESK